MCALDAGQHGQTTFRLRQALVVRRDGVAFLERQRLPGLDGRDRPQSIEVDDSDLERERLTDQLAAA
jgi:hypothetical protein